MDVACSLTINAVVRFMTSDAAAATAIVHKPFLFHSHSQTRVKIHMQVWFSIAAIIVAMLLRPHTNTSLVPVNRCLFLDIRVYTNKNAHAILFVLQYYIVPCLLCAKC